MICMKRAHKQLAQWYRINSLSAPLLAAGCFDYEMTLLSYCNPLGSASSQHYSGLFFPVYHQQLYQLLEQSPYNYVNKACLPMIIKGTPSCPHLPIKTTCAGFTAWPIEMATVRICRLHCTQCIEHCCVLAMRRYIWIGSYGEPLRQRQLINGTNLFDMWLLFDSSKSLGLHMCSSGEGNFICINDVVYRVL